MRGDLATTQALSKTAKVLAERAKKGGNKARKQKQKPAKGVIIIDVAKLEARAAASELAAVRAVPERVSAARSALVSQVRARRG